MTAPHYDPGSTGTLRHHRSTLKTLAPFLWPRNQFEMRVRVVAALALLVLAKGMAVYAPYLFKQAVAALSVDVEMALAIPLGLIVAYGVATVTGQAFGELRDAVFAKVGQRALRRVALNIFQHLHRLSLRFHLERRTGGLSRAIERGTKAISFLLSFMLFNILPTLLEIVLVCGVLFVSYGIWFALVSFISLAGYITFTILVMEWRLRFRREMNRQDSDANTKAIDSLLNFETVKYFDNEEHEARRFDVAMRRYERAAVRNQVSLSLLNIGQGIIIALGLGTVLYMASRDLVAGRHDISDFVFIHVLIMQVFRPLSFFGFVYREIKQSLVDMENMFDLLDVPEEVADRPNARPLDNIGGNVRFRSVDFAYDPERQILHDVDFEIPAGGTVAVVGPSGSGKSTLSRLMYRFYDVTGGAITIDGVDLRDATQSSLRKLIGIVPQDTVLFNDSIHYNILYGDPGASEEEIVRAAKLARIHDFVVSLPDGYATLVGERGLKLSGGEKQRVAIARTILKNPPILIFDEATSALDTHTEKEIQASLKEVSSERTTLVIAHRLSTIVDADEILVLEKGRIVERGKHDELLTREGIYARMWARQQQVSMARQQLADLEASALEPV